MFYLANCVTILNIMQVNFSMERCKSIFGHDYMHYWNKWTSTDGNIIEFINRLDETIIFNRLSKEHMSRIVDIQLKILHDRISSLNLKIELGAGARDWIAQQGYDPVYGARPLKRVIQNYLQNPIAELILAGKL